MAQLAVARREPRALSAPTRHAAVIKGTRRGRIHYELLDNGAPHTIVAASGWACPRSYWEPLLPYLSPFYNILLVENRGQGKSQLGDTTAATYLGDRRDDLQTVLDHLGIERALFVGHSMGGIVAERFYAAYPDRVSGLVFVCTPPANPRLSWAMGDTPAVRTLIDLLKTTLQSPGVDTAKEYLLARNPMARWVIRSLLRDTLLHRDGVANGSFARFYRELLSVPISVILMAGNAMLALPDEIQSRSYNVPTLYIAGDIDPLVRAGSVRRAAELAGEHFELLRGVGHLPSLECPPFFSQLIAEVASRTKQTQKR